MLRPLGAPSRSCWRGEWKHNGRAAPALRTASALPLLTRAVWNGRKPGSTESLALKAPLFTWSVKSFSCYNVLLWSSADHALAQVRPRQIFTRTLSKNGRSLEPCLTFEASLLGFLGFKLEFKEVIYILFRNCNSSEVLSLEKSYEMLLAIQIILNFILKLRKWQLRIFFVNPNPDFLFFLCSMNTLGLLFKSWKD